MSKTNSLPSIDGEAIVPASTPPVQKRATKKPAKPKVESLGHVSRTVDIRMTGDQPTKFKRIMRHLEDSGKTLSNGSPVNNKRRAALWLIENFEIPS